MKIEKKIADPKYYDIQREEKITYIVVQEIRNKATPHYHIANGKAVQIVPDNHLSNSVNGGKLNRNGYLHGICNKYNSISVGVSDIMSDEDKQACLDLIMTLKQRYRVKIENIVRQKDITGEENPNIWHDNETWKEDINDKLIELT